MKVSKWNWNINRSNFFKSIFCCELHQTHTVTMHIKWYCNAKTLETFCPGGIWTHDLRIRRKCRWPFRKGIQSFNFYVVPPRVLMSQKDSFNFYICNSQNVWSKKVWHSTADSACRDQKFELCKFELVQSRCENKLKAYIDHGPYICRRAIGRMCDALIEKKLKNWRTRETKTKAKILLGGQASILEARLLPKKNVREQGCQIVYFQTEKSRFG
jgi:hypothetical protein